MRARSACRAVVVAVVLAAASPAPADAPATDAPAAVTGPAVGAAAPGFEVKTLDGKTVSLATFRGKTLVVNAWATWCAPSRAELRDLSAAAPKLAKAGVMLLGVDTTEDAPLVRAYLAAKGAAYPLALDDAAGSFANAYDVRDLPTTFVIDARGVLRARYVDALAPVQLSALVAAAAAGRDGRAASPLQARIDALLTDSSIDFGGDAAAVEAGVQKAQSALAAADKLAGDGDAAEVGATDVLRTRAERSALRDKAIAALVGIGTSSADQALLPRLRGDAALDRERWQDALDAYRAALTLDPQNADVLAGIALASGRVGQYEAAVDAERRLVDLERPRPDNLLELARAQLKAGHAVDAYATFEQAAALAKRQLDGAPAHASFARTLAYVHLSAGRAYARNAERARARAEFEQASTWAQTLPSNDAHHDAYVEEAQEAIVALALATPRGGAFVSLAPWTGPEAPGSIPNTRKYRLFVVGVSGKDVALNAARIPKGWVASFCTDRVCSPSKLTLTIPQAGVKVVEFQLVPPAARARTPKIRVTARDGASVASATT